MRTLAFGIAALSLAACGVSSSNVYDQPLPARDDMDAMVEIRDALKPEDVETWQGIIMRMNMAMADPVRAKTVGEAISNQKAKLACMARNDVTKIPDIAEWQGDADTARYNRDVEAFNKKQEAVQAAYKRCQQMP